MEMNADDVKDPDHSVKLTFAWLWVAFGASMLVVGICLTTFAVGDGLFDPHFMGPAGFVLVCFGIWLVASGGLVIARTRGIERKANPALVSLLLLPCICFCQVIAGQAVSMPAAPSSTRHEWEAIPSIDVDTQEGVKLKGPPRSLELCISPAGHGGHGQGGKQERQQGLHESQIGSQDIPELVSSRRAYGGPPRVMGYGTAS